MKRILVLGAGKIGPLISCLLAGTKEYIVYLGDQDRAAADAVHDAHLDLPIVPIEINVDSLGGLRNAVKDHQVSAIVSSLPYFCNHRVAQVALEQNVHYFDLTEDIEATHNVIDISQGATKAFVPQCGLAPGFISIAAQHMMARFTSLDTVKMRVGALPLNPNNALKYSLTWSTDGLINEYGNPCQGIKDGKLIQLLALEGYETISLDGIKYEAFNTSGGLGSLADSYNGRVRNMSYKTLRYPGHCEKIQLLMNDLKLNDDRQTLKRILENSIPKTKQDVVLVYVSVSGLQEDQFYEENYVRKIYPQTITGTLWSAIQITTASSLCAVLDMVLQSPARYQGFIKQEQFSLMAFQQNRFGQFYVNAPKAAQSLSRQPRK